MIEKRQRVTGTNEQQLIRDLRQPSAWPGDEDEIGFVQTHISLVFLGRERVLKLKRPVHYSFVDYSTPEKRRQACDDEVRLNRLLSDDIYLGVVPIVRDAGGYRIGEEGDEDQAVEWGTWMRRIDEEQLLDGPLRRGDVPARLADRLADRLVPFHRDRPPEGRGDPEGTLDALLKVLIDNLDDVRASAGKALPTHEVSTVDSAMRGYIDEQRDALRQRVREGWVREGHGDLRCEHVVVPPDGMVQVFDCVEFNRALRVADIASDLAFLLMDLFRLDAPVDVIRDLIARYESAGIHLPVGLLRLYWMHRALVRAKVHGLRLAELQGDARLAVARKAVDYLHVAHSQAMTMRPALIAMTGLSGTGKSTVAESIVRATGARYAVADVVRKQLATLEGAAGAAWGEGIYTPEWTARTYDRLFEIAREQLQQGHPVVLDATFLQEDLRQRAADTAAKAGVPFVLVESVCDDDVVRERLAARQRAGTSPSDATEAVYRRQRERFLADPPAVPPGALHVRVDTTPDGPVSIDPVLLAMENAGIIVPGIREDGALV